jgi:hypothetical protein
MISPFAVHGIKAIVTKPFSLATVAGQIRVVLGGAGQKAGGSLRACEG